MLPLPPKYVLRYLAMTVRIPIFLRFLLNQNIFGIILVVHMLRNQVGSTYLDRYASGYFTKSLPLSRRAFAPF